MIEPRAWMISDPDGELATAVTMRPQNPVSETGLVIDKLVTVADVLAALRQPSEAMYRATDGLGDAYGYNHKTKRAEVTYETIQSLWKAMLDQFEKEQSSPAKKAYEAANPLGGPARMFEAIAERIRAGEDYYAVLADYGVTVEAK